MTSKNYYVYNDSLNNSYENFKAGYIDTFSIKKTKFRVLLNKDYLLNLESYQKGKWNIIFSFDYTQYGYFYDKDFDNDGIPDFAVDNKWNYSIHCFNLQTKTFYKDAFDIYEKNSLIDSKLNLYSDCQTYNYTHKKVYSDLYKIENGQKKLLYRLEFKQYHNGKNYTYFHIASLFKCFNTKKDKLIKQVKFKKSIEGDLDNMFEFDYEKYWKGFIKKDGLLPTLGFVQVGQTK